MLQEIRKKFASIIYPKIKMDIAWFKIVEATMKMALEVQQQGKPMLQQIACVDMSQEEILGNINIVSIWAAVGDANPIERCRHLKSQNTAMKELLNKCRGTLEVGMNNDLILNINIVLDTFE